ncbi:hypothetical protein L484_006806 [Morus notabilis]|uniref:Uncharacterized protein n=1 Tax=Morus notabilis TaxID=981085 RepID=W9RG43_9ROSA|nr:hypothetical protein L484_006806 [Morus notabilis]
MVDGTRLRVMDETIKQLQDSTSMHASALGSLQSTVEDFRTVGHEQQHTINELANKMAAMDGKLEQVLRLVQATITQQAG